jgi:hypothetical protein
MWKKTTRAVWAPDDAGAAGAAAGAAAPANVFDHVGDPGGAKETAAAPTGADNFPAWLPPQFVRKEPADLKADDLKMLARVDIEALARSQADLRTKFGRGEHKPPAKPEDYALELPKDLKFEIPKVDALMASARQAAHAAGFSNADFNKFMGPVVAKLAELAGASGQGAAGSGAAATPEQQAAQEAQQIEERKAAFKAELDKLGPQGEASVRQLGTWLKGLETKGVLSNEEFQSLRALTDAPGITGMRKLMELAGETPVPVDPAAVGIDLSIDDAKKLMIEAFKDGGDQSEAGRAKLAKARAALAEYERKGLLPKGS